MWVAHPKCVAAQNSRRSSTWKPGMAGRFRLSSPIRLPERNANVKPPSQTTLGLHKPARCQCNELVGDSHTTSEPSLAGLHTRALRDTRMKRCGPVARVV